MGEHVWFIDNDYHLQCVLVFSKVMAYSRSWVVDCGLCKSNCLKTFRKTDEW